LNGISVIVPVYNRADLLPETLRCLLAQTVPADEVIVVDDGSTDGTGDVAAGFGPPVKVIRQANAGPGVARNRGLAEARGDFIHFFDSDDIPALNKQESQLKALIDSGADVVMSPWVKGSFVHSGFMLENHVYQLKGLPSSNLIKRLLTDWSIVVQSCLFRRSLLDKTQGFPPELFVGEDQLLFLRALLVDAKVVHAPDTLTLYRADNSLTKLSGKGVGEAFKLKNWAKFLLMSRKECQVFNIEPAKWRGYQQRVWAAARDLQSLRDDAEAASIRNQLLEILQGTHTRLFFWRAWLAQKYGGLQQRLSGRRGPGSFRMGAMTTEQWKLTNSTLAVSKSGLR
jgi:glycosyltransferase involved in cell wall biosynthesis